jgi:3-ketoacyl-CoA synthase
LKRLYPTLLSFLQGSTYAILVCPSIQAAAPVQTCARLAGLKPTDIDILITNTSVYCPTPSIASLVVNMFKMREDIQCYHMGGMGCAFGVIGLNLARDMLIAHPGKICLFVSSEIITSAFYPGERREALVTNALFRMGGSASILTNNPAWRKNSKYQLQHCLRVHTGASDRAFK